MQLSVAGIRMLKMYFNQLMNKFFDETIEREFLFMVKRNLKIILAEGSSSIHK